MRPYHTVFGMGQIVTRKQLQNFGDDDGDDVHDHAYRYGCVWAIRP